METNTLERLRKRADFLKVQRAKKSVRDSLVLQARARKDDCADIRTGLTVSRKVGNAVERNRVRRRLREAMKAAAPVLGHSGHDYVAVGRRAALTASYSDIAEDLRSAFRHIHRAAKTASEART